MTKLVLFILVLAAVTGAWSTEAAFYTAPEDTPVQTEENDNEEAAVGDEELAEDTPLEEFTPTGATWEAWVGPLLLGLFVLLIWLGVRWYSLRNQQKKQYEAEEKRTPERRGRRE